MEETVFSINDVTELVFMNFMGVGIKFCYNIFAKEMTTYKETNKDKNSKNIKKLKKDSHSHIIMAIYEIDEFLKEA